MKRLLLVLLLLAFASPASAALSQTTLSTIAASPKAEARVPLDLPLIRLDGAPVTLGAALAGRPALLMLADYRCTQLCGSMLAIAAQALHGSRLTPRKDFTFALVGFNPDAGAADATAMRDAQLASFPDLEAEAEILTGEGEAVNRLEAALGFTAVRDQAAGRYAHPADLYVLTADGRISRVLNGLSLDPDDLRLALVEAGQGRIGSLVDRLHVLCYGLDPLSNASTSLALTILRLGAGLTLLAGGGWLIVLMRRRSPHRPRSA